MNLIAAMNWLTVLAAAIVAVGNLAGLWQVDWAYLWLAVVPPIIGVLILVFNRGEAPYIGGV